MMDVADVLERADFDLSRCHMRETKHINGGKDWFGYEHQCIEEPRLRRLDRYTRKDRSVQSTWRVDGEDCASLDAAVEELGAPPKLRIVELEMLARFNAPVMRKSDFGDFQEAYPILRALDLKGLIWWEDGKAQLRRDAVLDAIGSAESNASGNPEWTFVGPRVAAIRAALADQPLPHTLEGEMK